MIGWRARFGVMVPARNCTIEPELYKMAPDGISLHFDRLAMELGTEGESEENVKRRLLGYFEESITSARNLAVIDPEVIAFGCTSGSLYLGPDHDREVIKKIQKTVKIPTTTTSTAVIHALKELKINRVCVVTPYPDHLNKRVKSFLEAKGIRTLKIIGIKVPRMKSDEFPQRVYRDAKKIISSDCRGIFISCTALRSIDIIESLEEDTKKPVITSNQATMWEMLKIAKIGNIIRGYGQLFDTL